MQLFHSFSRAWPRPCIVEMGGKNPAIVSRHADLDEAAEGIMRSRVRVRRAEVLGQLAGLRRAARPRRAGPAAGREDRGDHHRRPARPRELARPDHRPEGGRSPPGRGLRGAPRRHGLRRRRAAERQGHGARLLRRADGRRALPASHRLFRDELFAPFTAVAAVDSIDEAITLANDSVYGLTAGVYSEDPAEVQTVPRSHRGRGHVRQSPRGRDHRRVAGRPGVRRLEGQWLDRQGRAVDVLRRAVPARAEPHDRRLAAAGSRARDAVTGRAAPHPAGTRRGQSRPYRGLCAELAAIGWLVVSGFIGRRDRLGHAGRCGRGLWRRRSSSRMTGSAP